MTRVDNEKTTFGRMRLPLVATALSLALLVTVACTGDAGAEGPDGSIGPPGRPGLTGERGPQGQTGPQGLAGSQGVAGSQGSAGPQGTQGPEGPGVPLEEVQGMVEEAVANFVPIPGAAPSPFVIAAGGRLYDNWISEIGASAPLTNQPLWADQSTNTRGGSDSYRCTECHGWDYKGAGGAYSSGSHFTGFTGVMRAGRTLTRDDLATVLNGSFNFKHDFGQVLSDSQVEALAAFLDIGLVDYSEFIVYETKKPRGTPDLANGQLRYSRTCSNCHGNDGLEINFGGAGSPEYIGDIASANPWEFLHKVLFGQPGPKAEEMPAVSTRGWTDQDLVDLLGYAQALFTE